MFGDLENFRYFHTKQWFVKFFDLQGFKNLDGLVNLVVPVNLFRKAN